MRDAESDFRKPKMYVIDDVEGENSIKLESLSHVYSLLSEELGAPFLSVKF